MSKEKKLKVLAVDDALEFRQLYINLLTKAKATKDQFLVETAASGEEALHKLITFEPDILILDIDLSDMNGIEICKKIRRKRGVKSYLGIIFVTGHSTPSLIAEGLASGADDFCTKDHTATELVARINSVTRIKAMTDSLQAANEKLKIANSRLAKISITDDLTKLFNMKYFKRRLNQEFTRSHRYQKKLSVIMFDLDHFKKVNDNADHLMGSHVISKVGVLVNKVTRSVDTAARFGGDEFIIMLPETDLEGANQFAERMRLLIEEKVFNNGLHVARITASFGVSTFNPEFKSFSAGVELVRAADRNLFLAKELGRNLVIDDNEYLDHLNTRKSS